MTFNNIKAGDVIMYKKPNAWAVWSFLPDTRWNRFRLWLTDTPYIISHKAGRKS